MPVVEFPADDEEPEHGLHWNTRSLTQWAGGCPFIWLDDEITDADRRWVRAHYPGTALSYRLDTSPLDAHTARVTTAPTGRPESGKTYWFMVEVNWGDGNIDYYPRRRLDDQADTFDVSIPTDARTDVVRTGRVHSLDEKQSANAEVRLAGRTR